MPRPRLGKSARTVMKSVRLTETEDKLLTAKYGTSGKALRALVNKELRTLKEAKP